MKIIKRQLRKLIRETLAEETDLYVIIGNAGQGRQTMWPKSAAPGVYSKSEAEKIAKEKGRESLTYGGGINWHVQPLSRDLLGGRYGVLPGNEAYIGLEELIQDYEAGGVESEEDNYERGFFRESKMKVTKRQLRRIIGRTIQENLATEEDLDELDSVSGAIGPLGAGNTSSRKRTRRKAAKANADAFGGGSLQKEDTSSRDRMGRDELRDKVHQYLIDKKFFQGETINGRPMIQLFWGPPKGPGVPKDAGYTNSAREFLKQGIASGDIDWATWEEIEPVWEQIDRMAD